MKKPARKTRNRLPGLIQRADTEDERWTLATYGPGFRDSEIFRAVQVAAICGPAMKCAPVERDLLEWSWTQTAAMAFLQAATELNAEPFEEAARAVRYLKEWTKAGGTEDPLRLVLLACKKAAEGWSEDEIPKHHSRALRNKLLARRNTSLAEFKERFPLIVRHLSDRQIYRAAKEVGFKFSDSRKSRA